MDQEYQEDAGPERRRGRLDQVVVAVQAGATLLKDGEFEHRLSEIESVVGDRIKKAGR